MCLFVCERGFHHEWEEEEKNTIIFLFFELKFQHTLKFDDKNYIIFYQLNTVNCRPQTIVITYTHTTIAILPHIYVRAADNSLCCRCDFSSDNDEKRRGKSQSNHYTISINQLKWGVFALHIQYSVVFCSIADSMSIQLFFFWKCIWAHLSTLMFQHTHISCRHTLQGFGLFFPNFDAIFRACYYNFHIDVSHSKQHSNDAGTVLHTVTYD